ncbi:uncharacterized protein LOC141779548 [Sebastes fasciatus]|uniref:uncharacterized protein LOC141779548 n=1 Tax=Sebastes fasciatus TaxID=394691 RepID=UPI003D9F9600
MSQQQIYKDLTVISCQQLSAELQAEKDKNDSLQLQLEKLKGSHEIDLSCQEEKVKHLINEVVSKIFQNGSLQNQMDHLNKLLDEKDSTPQEKKRALQDEVTALKVAHKTSQEKLQAEQEVNPGLLEDLSDFQDVKRKMLTTELEKGKSLQKQVDHLNKLLEEKNRTLQDELLIQTGSLQRQVEKTTLLQEKNSTLQGENLFFADKYCILQKKDSDLQEEMRDLKVAHKNNLKNLQAEQAVNQGLRTELEVSRDFHAVELKKLTTELEESKIQAEPLQKQVDNLNKLLEEKDSTLQEKNSTLQEENSTLQEENGTLEDDVLVKTGFIKKQIKKTALVQEEMKSTLQDDVLVQSGTLQKQVEKTALLQEQNNTLQEKNLFFADKYRSLQKKDSDLQEEVRDLKVAHKNSLKKLQAEQAVNQGLRTVLKVVRDFHAVELKILTTELEESKIQAEPLQKQVDNLNKLLEEKDSTLQEENSTLQEENSTLQEENRTGFIQKQMKKTALVQEEMKSTLQEAIRTLQEKNRTLQDEVLVQSGTLQKQKVAHKTSLKKVQFEEEVNQGLQTELEDLSEFHDVNVKMLTAEQQKSKTQQSLPRTNWKTWMKSFRKKKKQQPAK